MAHHEAPAVDFRATFIRKGASGRKLARLPGRTTCPGSRLSVTRWASPRRSEATPPQC